MLKRTLALFNFPVSFPLSAAFFSGATKGCAGLAVNGVINPASAEYIGKSIKRANEQKREAVVIEPDTPGGLDTSMRDIVKNIIGSEVPVIVYVSPSGARAASAGVFITLAAPVAAMSPGTNIGSAHPVGVGEKWIRYGRKSYE